MIFSDCVADILKTCLAMLSKNWNLSRFKLLLVVIKSLVKKYLAIQSRLT